MPILPVPAIACDQTSTSHPQSTVGFQCYAVDSSHGYPIPQLQRTGVLLSLLETKVGSPPANPESNNGTAAIANPMNTVRFSTLNKSINCVYQEDERDVPSLRCQTKFVLRQGPQKPANCVFLSRGNWRRIYLPTAKNYSALTVGQVPLKETAQTYVK